MISPSPPGSRAKLSAICRPGRPRLQRSSRADWSRACYVSPTRIWYFRQVIHLTGWDYSYRILRTRHYPGGARHEQQSAWFGVMRDLPEQAVHLPFAGGPYRMAMDLVTVPEPTGSNWTSAIVRRWRSGGGCWTPCITRCSPLPGFRPGAGGGADPDRGGADGAPSRTGSVATGRAAQPSDRRNLADASRGGAIHRCDGSETNLARWIRWNWPDGWCRRICV